MIDSVRLPVVEYPETDGNPMPDGDYQGDFYRYAVDAVREHFRPRPEVYVTGDHFIYLEEGNPKNRIAPDLYVVMNGGHHMRDTYKVWEEPGGYPDFVLEIVSPSTWRADLGAKRVRYAALGVGEYWLHDPHANFMNPALAGYRLVGRSYKPIAGVESSAGTLTIHSATLGLDLCLQGKDLRFFDPVRGRYLLNRKEAEARAAASEARAAASEAREAKAEIRAAKAESELLAAKAEVRTANAQVHAAETEACEAKAETRAAEARIAELERALAEKERG